MNPSAKFLQSVLDSLSTHIVVIDRIGVIQFASASWTAFGRENGCAPDHEWRGVNYVNTCEKAAAMGDQDACQAYRGITGVIRGLLPSFSYEYPCHSPDRRSWFMMRVSRFELDQDDYFVIAHDDITERKLAEERVRALADIDGMTQLYNRRYLTRFLDNEWRRCARLKLPLSLAIIDIDHFKQLNDRYGHQTGDDCLVRVAKAIANQLKRPGDVCARYGGEEFVVVLGNTEHAGAVTLLERILQAIRELDLSDPESGEALHLTVSAGLTTVRAENRENNSSDLLETADRLLYDAKETGRDRLVARPLSD